jgi:hypothetical protein
MSFRQLRFLGGRDVSFFVGLIQGSEGWGKRWRGAHGVIQPCFSFGRFEKRVRLRFELRGVFTVDIRSREVRVH